MRVGEKPIVWNGKYRGYDSPLDCYNALYRDEDLSRGELAKRDCGIYKILLKYRRKNISHPMLDDAIPYKDPRGGKRERLSDLEVMEYLGAFTFFRGNENEAADFFEISPRYMKGYWRRYKLIPPGKPGKPKTSKWEISRINDHYTISNGNASLTGKALKHSPDFVIKCWRKKGLKIRRPGHGG